MFIDNIDDYLTTEEVPMGFELTAHAADGDGELHTHSFFEIFYMVSGKAKHVTKKYGQSEVYSSLREGDTVLIPTDTAHCFFKENEYDYTHRDVVIRKSVFIDACNYLSPDLYDKIINGKIQTQINLPIEKIMQFEHKIKLINQILPSNTDKKSALIKSLLISLLECFLTSDTEEYFNNFPTWFNNLLANFNKVEYMQAGLDKITLGCNYDRKYLCHVFKKYTGVTMTEYLNEIRLNYALGMIQNTNKTVSAIAQYLGFSSISYFNVIFKQKYGITPKELRKSKHR